MRTFPVFARVALCGLLLGGCADPAPRTIGALDDVEDGGTGSLHDAGDAGLYRQCLRADCGAEPAEKSCFPGAESFWTGRCLDLGNGCEWQRLPCLCDVSECDETLPIDACGDGRPTGFTGRCIRFEVARCDWEKERCACDAPEGCAGDAPAVASCISGQTEAALCSETGLGDCQYAPPICP